MIEVEQCSKCGKLKIPDEIEERVKNGEEVEVDVNWSKIGTYASNTLLWETGGLNIDGCRIGTEENLKRIQGDNSDTPTPITSNVGYVSSEDVNKGRWPANVVLDPVSAEMLDRQSGESKSPENRIRKSPVGFGRGNVFGEGEVSDRPAGEYGDKGGASRFFKTVKRAKAFKNEDGERDFQNRMYYSAKAHKSERNAGLEDLRDVNMGQSGGARQKLKEGKDEYQQENPSVGLNKIKKVKNDIATLKPINLMRWLCRLVTPEDGTVLDPFAGSGTTGCACEIEGFDYILIEKRERFAKIIAPKRIEYWKNPDNWDELKEHEEVPNPKELRNGSLDEFTNQELKQKLKGEDDG